MRYLSVILWLLLGLLYYWVWSNSTATCCDANGLSIAGVVDTLSAADTDAPKTAAQIEAERKATEEAEKRAEEQTEKAIADAAKTKTVTSVKSTDATGGDKLTFYFPYNSSQTIYANQTESDLNEIVSSAKASGKKVIVSGHTDDRGPGESNKELGLLRADEVRKKLISKGLSSSQVVALSFGEEKPIASNATSEGRQRNRRVELIIE